LGLKGHPVVMTKCGCCGEPGRTRVGCSCKGGKSHTCRKVLGEVFPGSAGAGGFPPSAVPSPAPAFSAVSPPVPPPTVPSPPVPPPTVQISELYNMKLNDLREVIDREGLSVSKAIGGRNRRTKDHIIADICAARSSQSVTGNSSTSAGLISSITSGINAGFSTRSMSQSESLVLAVSRSSTSSPITPADCESVPVGHPPGAELPATKTPGAAFATVGSACSSYASRLVSRFAPSTWSTQAEAPQSSHSAAQDEALMQQLRACGFRRYLKPYQCQGVLWMKQQEQRQPWQGGVLADDMGLGKTLQMLCVMALLRRPTLFICPLTAFKSWTDDIKDFFDPDTFTVFDVREIKSDNRTLPEHMPANTIVMINPESLWRDVWQAGGQLVENPASHCLRGDWGRIVCDEAQFLKNLMSKPNEKNLTSKACVALCANKPCARWCLTGTLVENHPRDYLSLLVFLRAEPFCQQAWFAQHVEPFLKDFSRFDGNDCEFQRCFKDTCLRRTKGGLPAGCCPEKHLCLVKVSMTPEECQREKELLKEESTTCQFTHVLRSSQAAGSLAMPRAQVPLPVDENSSLEDIQRAARRPVSEGGLNCSLDSAGKSPEWCLNKFKFERAWIEADKTALLCGAKWQALARLLRQVWGGGSYIDCVHQSPEAPEAGHWNSVHGTYKQELATNGDSKVVLISSLGTRTFELAEILLRQLKVGFARIDQTVPANSRPAIIDDFNDNPNVKVMLLGLKAGGAGINLQSAQVAILLDCWWNPASERQALDRIHRISSNHGHNYFFKIRAASNFGDEQHDVVQVPKIDMRQRVDRACFR